MKIYTYAMAFLVMLLFAGCKNKVSDYNTTESSEKPNISDEGAQQITLDL